MAASARAGILSAMTEGIPFDIAGVPEQSWDVGELRARRRRLGAAAGAERLGVAIIEIAPGARPTPPHAHMDEDELFLVLAGSGLSYQSSGSRDARAYAIGVDDVLLHPSGGDSHTLIAGDEGLTVLVVAEGSRTGLTWLPRTRQFWIGPRWSPADTPPPFVADAELGPLEVPAATAERPRHDPQPGRAAAARGPRRPDWRSHARRARHGLEAARARPRRDAAGQHNTDLHFHSAREECWYVRGGSGVARIGEEAHALRPARSGCAAPTAASGTASRSAPRAWT